MDLPGILHVPRRFAQEHWGGTESVVLNLCRQQLAAGFRAEIHTSLALSKTRREIWRAIPIHRYAHFYPWLGLSAEQKRSLDLKAGNLVSPGLFAGLLRARNVRIFHAHATNRLGGQVLTAARLKRRPCVVTLHGNVFDIPEVERSSLGVAHEGHFEWGKPLGFLLRSRSLLELADAVVCVGHSEYQKASQALPHDRVHYLPNGVNPESFASGDREGMRHKLGFDDTHTVFGCVSRIDPQKDQRTLIAAFGRIANKHPNARLVLAGPVTQPEYRDELTAAVESRELAERVQILPAVEAESAEHSALLHALDAFVLPSRHEPFGIVVLEAWAAKLAVIVAETGGLQRLVEPDKDGLRFPPGDVESLAGHLSTLANSPERRRVLGDAGHRKVVAEYTWKSAADRQEAIYQRAEQHCSR